MDRINYVTRGAIGGLAGGVPFGMMMGMMGMLPMIGGMLGMPSAIAGFAVHMMMSAMIGAGFGLVAGRIASSAKPAALAGLAYGASWWVLGPLLFMPWIMGMGFAANLSGPGIAASMPSLAGHMVFGAVLGLAFHRLGSRVAQNATAAGTLAG
jgi:hypothetical protein